jgi:hypothetical protein
LLSRRRSVVGLHRLFVDRCRLVGQSWVFIISSSHRRSVVGLRRLVVVDRR